MLDPIIETIQQLAAIADPIERITTAGSAILRLGWERVTIELSQPKFRLITLSAVGVGVSRRADREAYVYTMADFPDDGERYGHGYLSIEEKAAVVRYPMCDSDKLLCGYVALAQSADDPLPEGDALTRTEILFSHIAAATEAQRLADALEETQQQLTLQVEDLTVLQSVDEELNSSLNLENVLVLAADWAIRRTRARTALIAVATADGSALTPLVTLGFPRKSVPFNAENPIPLSYGVVGRAALTQTITVVEDLLADPDYMPWLASMRSQIAVPMEAQGKLLGVISLQSERLAHFRLEDLEFLKRLAIRTATALDNARLYREAEARADEASALYSAGRTISSSLEREEILPRIAQSIALVMSVSGAVIADFQRDQGLACVLATYHSSTTDGARETLPTTGTLLHLDQFPMLMEMTTRHHTLEWRASNPVLSGAAAALFTQWEMKTALVTPLFVGDELLGFAFATESRRERRYSAEEVLLFETLASQSAVALRQAKLYDEVRELENLKGEMIRMASHDLKNPLANVIGYLDLFNMTLEGKLDEEQLQFMYYMRKSAHTMKALIDDLLTLEHIDSERKTSYSALDFGTLVQDIFETQKATAELKRHSLLLEHDGSPIHVIGSAVQLRQATANLVGNALKYIPDGGQIVLRVVLDGGRIRFEAEDNGYGLSADQQKRLFQRFYRAKQPGTEEIPGTGLGLSMVKAIIERHGGEVWVRSQEQVGSTFGFWLPIAEPTQNEADL